MSAADDDQALEALLTAARGIYDTRVRFHLSHAQVLAFVRGLLAACPGLTVAELTDLAGRVGVPTSVLVRAARGEPAPAPIEKPNAWSRRTRLAEGLW